MAMGIHGFSSGRRRGRGARAPMAEINVTPLVDVMLVLLIVFMISAPLLTAGVEVELPKTEAGSMQDETEPLTLTIRADGRASYEVVAQVMAGLSTSGFTKINLITDTGGPSSGGEDTPGA